MDHLTLKAVATTTTDQGVFEAVISTETVDREKDIVLAAAMVTALKKWNRPIPLAWNHGTAPEDIFGSIEPMTVREAGGEVHAGGQVDLESKVGQEAWRSFKSRTIGFSFGYIMLQHTERKGGGREIAELDVFEITATPTPMNNDTRVLDTKAATEELRRESTELEREVAEAQMPNLDGVEPPPPEPTEEQKRIAELAEQVEVLTARVENPEKSPEKLRHESTDLEREITEAQHPNLDGIEPPPPEPTDEQKQLAELGEQVKSLTAQVEDLKTSVVEDARDDDRSAGKSEAQDALRKRSDDIALELVSDGMSLRKSPRKVEEPAPELEALKDLKRKSHDLALETLLSDWSPDG